MHCKLVRCAVVRGAVVRAGPSWEKAPRSPSGAPLRTPPQRSQGGGTASSEHPNETR
ncbi:hypothetical protein Scani_72680 [Streptomyces caniferus]|uniref:Uncharacterized protein n=1 Tax=Streptomyces caniferus TaxID=285557 RepID=A0A640SJ54_9ACTN|nr:hypothetical protein Scani_72680 [Streptomyces caniferus]